MLTPALIVRTTVIALASLALIGCAETSWSRTVGPRGSDTIFSPLDLPAPNRIRTGSGAPGPDYWQQQVDYVIDATLDTEADAVRGQARVTYTNNSPDSLDYLWLHLEQNLFRADSLGAQKSQAFRARRRSQPTDGYLIEPVHDASGQELPLTVYDTMGRLDLPTPIPPGRQFVFDIEWSFTIPPDADRRMGIEDAKAGKIYELAQWFPAVAVYDDVHGWNNWPYLGSGEFYTNFGTYEVTLTVPRDHIVAATGVLQNPQDVFTDEQMRRLEEARTSEETVLIRSMEEVGDAASRPDGTGPLSWRFHADNVRTFAWASSAAFIYDACGLDDILVQSVYPEEKQKLWSKSTQMLRTAIAGYNTRLYPYPYPEATNVYGAEGGMEYPMIIFCRGSSERGLYSVTTHEIGHNWFPMMVNTDERRHAWMDEGFDTFINHYSTADWFEGETGRRGSAARYARRMGDVDSPPIDTPPDHLPRRLVGRLQYQKTGVGLILLREQILGEERFDHAFRTYVARWAFKSPRPADFFRTMEDASGQDLAWFWRGWYLESGSLDQQLRGVAQTEADESYLVTVTIDNQRELVMPIVLDVIYENGETEQRRIPVEAWHGTNRFRAAWKSVSRVDRVDIDKDHKFPDVDRTNNFWVRRPPPFTPGARAGAGAGK